MFGMGFTEILIILVIAILFLGPEKLPTAIVDMAKFFRQMKTTIGSMKDSLEEEMSVSEIKQEALSYKKQLLEAQESLKKVVDLSELDDELTNIDDEVEKNTKNRLRRKQAVKETTKAEVKEPEPEVQVEETVVTFKKKKKIQENENV